MQQLPQYPSSSNQEHGPTSSIAAPKPTDFGYHPPVGTPGYSSHAEGSPVMGHPVPLSMQHGPTVVDVDNTIYYPPATVIAPAMNPNGYCVVSCLIFCNNCTAAACTAGLHLSGCMPSNSRHDDLPVCSPLGSLLCLEIHSPAVQACFPGGSASASVDPLTFLSLLGRCMSGIHTTNAQCN